MFHLHVKPEYLADKVILVGDPGRVALVASHFDTKECEVESREFRTITGTYQGKRITVTSTGIGCDNVDIVMNELDALANINFQTREENDTFHQLEIVRIGTCGGLQPYTPVGTYICSAISVGFDGLLNFYEGRNAVCDLPMERALLNHLGWAGNLCAPAPYVIHANEELVDRIAGTDMVRGVTVACGGFFGPQGRQLRIPLADPHQNEKIESFEYQGHRITNFEMESSALAGLARLQGHKATTVCMVIANRVAKEANTGYKNKIDDLIKSRTRQNLTNLLSTNRFPSTEENLFLCLKTYTHGSKFQINLTDKRQRYLQFLEQFAPLIESEKNEISVLANTSAALKEAFGFFWVGFYLVHEGELHLGPFQGSVACYRIRKGRGVCGTAWAEARTQLVPDVDQFPGHIACSSLSRSEIVVPIIAAGEVRGVLDIDSDQLATFDETDREYLEKVVDLLVKTLYAHA